jgi:RHS repeat-associated protein
VGRLTSWTRADGQPVTYGYDGASNRTTVTGPGGTRNHSYDARNRLTGASGGGEPAATNTWSDRGTLQTATVGTATTTYTNDAFDMPVGVAGPGYTASYAYDALGRLAQRSGTALVYPDLTDNAARVPGAAGDAVLFRAPDGTPMSDRHGTGAAQLLVADRMHGDRTAAVNPTSGAVVASRSYDPYGTVTATSGQFSGGFQDGWTDPNAGLVNAHARWYDPGQGAFTSRDSWTIPPDHVAAVNRYAYGNGNPIVNADPTGHCPPCAIPIGYWIGGLIVAAVVTVVVVETVDMQPVTSAAQRMLDRLMELQIEAMTATILGLYQVGLTAEQILEQIRRAFANNSAVIAITGPPAVTVPVTVPGTTAVTAPVIPPPPPISQTLPNVIAPPVSLLPVGELLQNTIPATAALAFPQIMNANADGSEASNTAAAAAAVGAVEGATSDLADTGDPNKCGDDPVKIITDIAQEIADQGLDVLDKRLSQDQLDAAEEEPWRKWQYRGSEVHKMTAAELAARYGKRFIYHTVGVDFLDTLTGKLIELTTPGQVANHKKKGGDYATCDYARYKFPGTK